MKLAVESLTGAEVFAAMPDLARLRMTVFSAWPYLYDGDPVYEENYLREFLDAPDSVVVVARNGNCIVGAATASPMNAQKLELRAPFLQRGINTDRLFYFGESVLLPEYRGLGIGYAFFDHREAQALQCGATAATFAAVVRSADHPGRPEGYAPLDPFWTKCGYAPVRGLVAELAWKEHGETEESPKRMQYWLKTL